MHLDPIDLAAGGESAWAEVSERYARWGIVVLRNGLEAADLEALQAEAVLLRGMTDARYRLVGAEADENAHIGERYSIAGCHRWRPRLAALIASERMRQLCQATIGCPAHLFTEQFLMKGPGSEMDFGWHQDGGYAPAGTPPFLVVWCALDDATGLNGTLRVLASPSPGFRSVVAHRRSPENGELVACEGSARGVPVPCSTGDIVAFSSLLPHRSENNRSSGWRRAYQIRYTPTAVVDEIGGRPLFFADRVFG